MEFRNYFPIWDKLTAPQKQKITDSLQILHAHAGAMIHNGNMDCLGLLVVRKGQLRVYVMSPEGREVTLYRLFDRDICLFTSSCVMPDIQFEVAVEAEKVSEMWVIPAPVFKELMEESAPVANFTNQLISSRFSEVMWLMEQIMWKSFDKRLATFLLEESALEHTDYLKITHEKIANHLGTAREVVTRMLRYFQNEGIVSLSRGTVDIVDKKKLIDLQDD